ncbi:hypothetical protein L2E82_44307 [Cichorium intybus]|uniref:Uncharacterized protein n=1 Tax=Cichorium intybus TaxID=13427 RepID=A0ACB8ZP86_CICIN|nr:hypothetical protein L2E82_44307 [Cichorium intybus]
MYTGLQAAAPSKIKPAKKFTTKDDWPYDFKYRNVSASDVPPALDWRAKGSCYAFVATDTIESLHAIQTKQLVELSPKEILDCCNCGGCKGGKMENAYRYVAENNGLTTEKNYPYKPAFETCAVKKENDIAVKIGGYQLVPLNNEEALMAAVVNQPIQVSIAVEPDFKMYKEGVLTSPCGTKVVHGVIAVGYDTAPDGTKYWIMKNSWGADWGDNGYTKMLRGVPEKEGYCGLCTGSHFPLTEPCSKEHAPGGDPVVKSSKDL